MFKRNLISLAFGAALAIGAVSAYAFVPSVTGDLAREAAEGPRGADNERPGDRHRRGGRGLTTDSPADQVIARSKPRVPGGSGCDDPRDLIEHPECNVPKNTAPGIELVAREASEGPRGADNERPGDRQRRGGG